LSATTTDTRIHVNKRKVNVGDMHHRVLLHTRSITPPVFGSIDFTEAFAGNSRWASIHTKDGKLVMDDVGRDVNSTHQIYIRYDSVVDSETFVQSEDGRRFKVLSVENFDNRKEYMKLNCTDRGLNEAAKA